MTPSEAVSLPVLADTAMAQAGAAGNGRAATTVCGGAQATLRQTLIALSAGAGLAEHDNPGEATVHVLRGRIRLSAGGGSTDGGPGDLLVVPPARHALQALEDSVVLLTVAMRG